MAVPRPAVGASEKVILLCRENGVPDRLGNCLGVAAEELCTNIAKYAYGKRTDEEGESKYCTLRNARLV